MNELLRHQRWLRRYVGSLVAVGIAALVFVGVLAVQVHIATADSGVVRAQRFELVDAGGSLRGLWTVSDGGVSYIELYAMTGEQAVRIRVGTNGSPSVQLRDRNCDTPTKRVQQPCCNFRVYDCGGDLTWEAPRKN